MKPCPFCGSTEIEMHGSDLEYWVGCLQCQTAGPFGRTETEAEQRWSNRVREKTSYLDVEEYYK